MQTDELTAIKKDLELLKKAVAEIRLNIDPDMVLDEDDTTSLQIYKREKHENNLVHNEQVKKDFLSS